MKVLVLTSNFRGFGAYCLPRLAEAEGVDVDVVVYNKGEKRDRIEYTKRKLKKALKIGPLGALNGIRMRSWFKDNVRKYLDISDIKSQSEKYEINYKTTPKINCHKTVKIFEESVASVGLSLGNSYISEKVFGVPKYGMLNVHHEKLPDFQGAQSVLWQIYEGSEYTGYTIHRIDEKIDGGDILYSEDVPIEFKDSLEDTVSFNYAKLYKESLEGLIEVIRNFERYWRDSKPQVGGRSYTTPSLWQYLKMVYNHRKLARKEEAGDA